MTGIITAIIAGAAMSIQGVFNTRLGEKTGVYEANVVATAIALICAIITMLVAGKGNISAVGEANKLYLLGGVLGTVITVTVMLAIGNLSPAYATAIILVSQLAVSALIDGFGLFGTEQAAFTWRKIIGLVVMIGGIVIFER